MVYVVVLILVKSLHIFVSCSYFLTTEWNACSAVRWPGDYDKDESAQQYWFWTWLVEQSQILMCCNLWHNVILIIANQIFFLLKSDEIDHDYFADVFFISYSIIVLLLFSQAALFCSSSYAFGARISYNDLWEVNQ